MANTVTFFEIGTADPVASQAFYGSLFDWSFSGPTAAAYAYVNDGAGGMWDTTQLGSPNWAVFYVTVDSVTDAIAQAVELGATVAIPRTDTGQIVFSHLIDPLGNRFGVWRRKVG